MINCLTLKLDIHLFRLLYTVFYAHLAFVRFGTKNPQKNKQKSCNIENMEYNTKLSNDKLFICNMYIAIEYNKK